MVWRRHALAAHFCQPQHDELPSTRGAVSSLTRVKWSPVTPHEGRICAGGRVSALAEVDNGYGISPNANHSRLCRRVACGGRC